MVSAETSPAILYVPGTYITDTIAQPILEHIVQRGVFPDWSVCPLTHTQRTTLRKKLVKQYGYDEEQVVFIRQPGIPGKPDGRYES